MRWLVIKFDIILCQQGLQFSPDPLATLKEMARVMMPGGRLAISLWRDLKRYPCFMAFTEGLEHKLGKESTDCLQSSFSLANASKIRTLLQRAGFIDVHIRLEVKMARYPQLEEFIWGYLAATPLAGEIMRMKEHDRSDLSQRIITSLHDYVDDEGLAAPMECHIITAKTKLP